MRFSLARLQEMKAQAAATESRLTKLEGWAGDHERWQAAVAGFFSRGFCGRLRWLLTGR